jgi:hypothetical protein
MFDLSQIRGIDLLAVVHSFSVANGCNAKMADEAAFCWEIERFDDVSK